MYSKKILINNLKKDMVTSEDLVINGRKLLNKDYTITESILNALKDNYPSYYISIYNNDGTAFIEQENSKLEALEKNLVSTQTLIKNLFAKLKEKNAVSIADLRPITTNILEYAKKYSTNIIKLLNRSYKPDEYLYGHSLNVSILSVMIGIWLNIPKNSLSNLATAGILHDIGKLNIPDKIINKKGHLTSDEFKICKNHALMSYETAKRISLLSSSVLQAILFHHERFDGSGYPTHLKEETIPLFARIIAVADVFDAITSNRCYTTKESPLYALKQVYEESFSKLDPRICTTFIHNIAKFYEGQKVLLNNDKTASILKLNMNNYSKPIICLDNDVIDLSNQNELSIVDFS